MSATVSVVQSPNPSYPSYPFDMPLNVVNGNNGCLSRRANNCHLLSPPPTPGQKHKRPCYAHQDEDVEMPMFFPSTKSLLVDESNINGVRPMREAGPTSFTLPPLPQSSFVLKPRPTYGTRMERRTHHGQSSQSTPAMQSPVARTTVKPTQASDRGLDLRELLKDMPPPPFGFERAPASSGRRARAPARVTQEEPKKEEKEHFPPLPYLALSPMSSFTSGVSSITINSPETRIQPRSSQTRREASNNQVTQPPKQTKQVKQMQQVDVNALVQDILKSVIADDASSRSSFTSTHRSSIRSSYISSQASTPAASPLPARRSSRRVSAVSSGNWPDAPAVCRRPVPVVAAAPATPNNVPTREQPRIQMHHAIPAAPVVLTVQEMPSPTPQFKSIMKRTRQSRNNSITRPNLRAQRQSTTRSSSRQSMFIEPTQRRTSILEAFQAASRRRSSTALKEHDSNVASGTPNKLLSFQRSGMFHDRQRNSFVANAA